MPFELPDLPYPYDALEPHIDAETMKLHHDKHHATYVEKANAALEGTELADAPVEEVLARLGEVPEDRRTAARNNAGGHANHSLFWEVMGPADGAEEPSGTIAVEIDGAFGSFSGFQKQFADAAAGLFGSGWVWLVPSAEGLAIETAPNQDTPLMKGRAPVLGLDVWEHAYYLKYRNKRPDYVAAWWNVVNWDAVETRFAALRGAAAATK